MKRAAARLACWAVAATVPLWGYAHFLHYGSNGQVIPERFDLNQLPLSTVTFYVSDQGPTVYAGSDSFPSVVNQIRQAASVWNGVATSALRVAFGGLYALNTPDNSPGGDVVFEEMPAGVLAFSGPTTCEDPNPASGEPNCIAQTPDAPLTFLPILRSTMHMSQDLSQLPGPSFGETFFLVSVHEMGHALGLQHTFTSSAMSTIATRATSLDQPIQDDDRMGVSLLYPVAGFPSQFGSVTGTVTYADDSSPVHMASVIAIRAGAPAISALTLPDGSFEIDGLSSGQYFLYVHPLAEPSADIRAPIDVNGNSVNPTQPFDAVAYPGVISLLGATAIPVTAGQTTSGLNFSVTPRADVPIFDIDISSYFYPDAGNPSLYIPAHPAFVNGLLTTGTLGASGAGLGSNGIETDGLNVQVIGGTANVYATQPYVDANTGDTDLGIYLQYSNFGAAGPQDLLFATPDYLYILPSALNVVQGLPPMISSITPNGDGTVTVTGQNFAVNTQIYFDALAGTVHNVDVTNQAITLTPPDGASSQTATLTAYNPDGQTSMFLQLYAPAQFSYPQAATPSVTVSPAVLPAAVEAMVTITGTNTNFVQGHTAIGFGTHDVIVRRTFVLSPTEAIVDVSIPAGAAQITTEVTALTDFQMAVAPQAFQIQPAQPGLPSGVPILFNAVANQSGSFAGAVVTIYGLNLTDANGDTPAVTFNGTPATILYASPGQINLTIPSSLTPGLATMLVNNGAAASYPTTVSIDPPQPVITEIDVASLALNPAAAVNSGQAVDILLTGFAPSGTIVNPGAVQVSFGGVTVPALSVNEVGSTGVFDVEFDVAANVPAGSQTLVVYINGLSSVPGSLTVAGN